MSIQDLGSLGEFIAAIATLATLVYLAVQIRLNTKSVRASTFHEIISDFAHGIEELNQDAELTRIWYEGRRDFSDLSDLEKQRFATYVTAILRRYENVLYQSPSGTLDQEAITGISEQMKYAFAGAVMREWWSQASQLFNPELQEHIENQLLPKDLQLDVTK